jgi:vacuolar-type H+-ATPase subunit E/Vma4
VGEVGRQRDLANDLAPVRAALLDNARAEAARIEAAAVAAAEAKLAAAREEAERILAQAREQGAADAAAVLAADRARARRRARAVLLAARREGYEALRAAVREAVYAWRDDPGYPQLRTGLARAARRALGPGTRVRDAADGGVIGYQGGRRLDVSLTGFADRAADACAAGLDEP